MIAAGIDGGSRAVKVVVFDAGTPVEPVPETAVLKLREKEVTVELDLGLGEGASVMWTCDLTKDYIDINAHYHT